MVYALDPFNRSRVLIKQSFVRFIIHITLPATRLNYTTHSYIHHACSSYSSVNVIVEDPNFSFRRLFSKTFHIWFPLWGSYFSSRSMRWCVSFLFPLFTLCIRLMGCARVWVCVFVSNASTSDTALSFICLLFYIESFCSIIIAVLDSCYIYIYLLICLMFAANKYTTMVCILIT